MKSKKFHKKLNLGKTTVANLNRNGMTRVIGGATEYTCPSNCPSCEGTCVPVTGCVSGCPQKCPDTDPTTTTGEQVTCYSFCVTECC
jgi:hypothetical protein